MFLFLICTETFVPPRGSSPEMWEKYKNAMDIENNVFHCFSSNKTIPLNKINDNYADCEDGSDEPGTSASQKGYFYCKNEGDTPKLIPFWSVGDGICDCCDGSDEEENSHAVCENVCKGKKIQNQHSQNKIQNIDTEKTLASAPAQQRRTSYWKDFFISFWKIH